MDMSAKYLPPPGQFLEERITGLMEGDDLLNDLLLFERLHQSSILLRFLGEDCCRLLKLAHRELPGCQELFKEEELEVPKQFDAKFLVGSIIPLSFINFSKNIQSEISYLLDSYQKLETLVEVPRKRSMSLQTKLPHQDQQQQNHRETRTGHRRCRSAPQSCRSQTPTVQTHTGCERQPRRHAYTERQPSSESDDYERIRKVQIVSPESDEPSVTTNCFGRSKKKKQKPSDKKTPCVSSSAEPYSAQKSKTFKPYEYPVMYKKKQRDEKVCTSCGTCQPCACTSCQKRERWNDSGKHRRKSCRTEPCTCTGPSKTRGSSKCTSCLNGQQTCRSTKSSKRRKQQRLCSCNRSPCSCSQPCRKCNGQTGSKLKSKSSSKKQKSSRCSSPVCDSCSECRCPIDGDTFCKACSCSEGEHSTEQSMFCEDACVVEQAEDFYGYTPKPMDLFLSDYHINLNSKQAPVLKSQAKTKQSPIKTATKQFKEKCRQPQLFKSPVNREDVKLKQCRMEKCRRSPKSPVKYQSQNLPVPQPTPATPNKTLRSPRMLDEDVVISYDAETSVAHRGQNRAYENAKHSNTPRNRSYDSNDSSQGSYEEIKYPNRRNHPYDSVGTHGTIDRHLYDSYDTIHHTYDNMLYDSSEPSEQLYQPLGKFSPQRDPDYQRLSSGRQPRNEHGDASTRNYQNASTKRKNTNSGSPTRDQTRPRSNTWTPKYQNARVPHKERYSSVGNALELMYQNTRDAKQNTQRPSSSTPSYQNVGGGKRGVPVKRSKRDVSTPMNDIASTPEYQNVRNTASKTYGYGRESKPPQYQNGRTNKADMSRYGNDIGFAVLVIRKIEVILGTLLSWFVLLIYPLSS